MDALWLTLYELLLIEERYRLLTDILAVNTLEEAMIHFQKAVPCLLYLENQGSECLIYHLLLKGW